MTPLLSSALLRVQTDERLVELAAAGHDRAFEAIVERYRRPLMRYLRRLLSEALAEDVVQATFINAWSSLRTGTEVRDLRPWLYRIAHNAAINALKKVGEAMEEVPESIGGFATEPAAELERRDEMQRALTSIAALPSRQRAALLAVAVDGRAHSDVAQELGLTDGAVRQLVHRARTTLRTGATAVTPLPFMHALMASAGDSTVGRVAEVAAGAGGAGAASVSLKAGAAAVIATGALVTGGPKVAHIVHPSARVPEPSAQAAAMHPAPAPAATTASVVTTAAGSSGPTSHGASSKSGSSSSSSRRSSGSSGHGHRGRDGSGEQAKGSRTGGHHRGRGDGDDAAARTRHHSGRSPSSGRDGGGDGARHEQDRPRTTATSGRHPGADDARGGDGQAPARPGGGRDHGGKAGDDLVVTPPTTTAPDGADGGRGGHADAAPTTTPRDAPSVVTPIPTTPTQTTGGEVRTESSGGPGGGG